MGESDFLGELALVEGTTEVSLNRGVGYEGITEKTIWNNLGPTCDNCNSFMTFIIYKIVVYFGTNFARLSDVFGIFILSINHDVGQSRTESFLRRCCFDQ